ncbi:type VI secretion system accessory protein TagJ [Tateyamaria sp. ANG-S1]|uniref:type VI secretion system accessory protein TagJ n=1 Tax=Tateyamaria sp. ANG-S1 TaxID=1577905 RepID=UPI00057EB581|nr:type VI secretion system accessory protein TagJ [Tateyamaria sp. ANG-S1]KIC47726.1 virulence protein SciE type [Tateyamaria sp. ANG-S1]
MQAEDLLKSGDIDGALSALQDAVRADASNAALRIFLFQLLAVRGEWKRAIAQLKVSAELDDGATAMAQTYREGIICEVYRDKVFAGEKDPLIFGEPQEWIALMVEALKANAAGRHTEAAEARARAFDAAPTTSGTLDGERFEWIADADMRLGPLLEVVVNGKYYWMPFTALSKIEFEPPADLRDAVWTPAMLTLANGSDIVALIPTRYAGTLDHGGPSEKLARATDWRDVGSETFCGIGQRTLATDLGDTALMDARLIELDTAAETENPTAADAPLEGD